MVMMNGTYQRYPQAGPNGRPAVGSTNTVRMTQTNSSSSNNAYTQYQQNAINTASPQELTLMLYNGLVRFLKMAYEGINEKDIEKANTNIIKSQNIISEFMCTLDMKYEVSEGLMAIYDYMKRRLIEANLQKDASILEEMIGYAEELRDTWAQAMKLAKNPEAAEL